MTGVALDAHVVVERPDGFGVDVALRAEPGEVVAVMGPSGAGKSTLLAAIAGLVRPTSGVISMGGVDAASARAFVPPHRRGAVLLGQEPRLFPHVTVRGNVAFGMRAKGVRRHDAERQADEWLARVGLPGIGARRPAELSGGQQQRVAVARALASRPRVLLLDEPLTSLDPETAGDIRALLQEQLAASGVTAVVVTHDVVDAVAVASRLIVVEAGRVSQEGLVRDVLAAPATRFVATIAGLNRVVGRVEDGRWRAGEMELRVDAASLPPADSFAAVFRPAAVHLHVLPGSVLAEPGRWQTQVARIEPTPGGVRVHTTAPAVAVDISVEEAADLRLAPGTPVWLQLDAADVRLQPVALSVVERGA